MPSCVPQINIFPYFKIISPFFNSCPDFKIYLKVLKINFYIRIPYIHAF